jgi:tetratricopeptide (TPR) repeat protein
MALHQAGRKAQAREALQQLWEIAKEYPNGVGEQSLAELIHEAQNVIDGPHLRQAQQALARRAWADVVRHLDPVIEIDPGYWPHHFNRGVALAKLGEADRAAADFDAAMERLPNDAGQWRRVGQTLASLRQWKEAARALARSVQLQPTADGEAWFEHACLRLLAGDRDGWRRACAEMLRRVRDPQSGVRGYLTARACTLAAGAVEDGTLPGKVAAQELGNNKGAFWVLAAQAGLHYRAGRFAEAAAAARRCLEQYPRWDGNVLCWLWLALAEHRLGHADEAARWLAKAAAWLDKHRDGRPLQAEGDVALHLHDWLEAHVLRREAEGLIGGGPPPG